LAALLGTTVPLRVRGMPTVPVVGKPVMPVTEIWFAGTVIVTVFHSEFVVQAASPVRVNVTIISDVLTPGTITAVVTVVPPALAANVPPPVTPGPEGVIVAAVPTRPGRVTTTLWESLPAIGKVLHAAPPAGWGAVIGPVMDDGDGDTTTVRVALFDPTEFVAVIVKVNDPSVVGVPDNMPAAERDSPGGKSAGLADHVGAGEPVALKAKL